MEEKVKMGRFLVRVYIFSEVVYGQYFTLCSESFDREREMRVVCEDNKVFVPSRCKSAKIERCSDQENIWMEVNTIIRTALQG